MTTKTKPRPKTRHSQTEFDCSECGQHVILNQPVPGLSKCPDCFIKERRAKIEANPSAHALTLAMCPECGSYQLTLPLDDHKRVSVKIDITDMVVLIQKLISQIEAFRTGNKAKIDQDVFLPIPCCHTSH